MVRVPQTAPQSGGSHLVLVPVPGGVVLAVCVVLVLACLVWLLVLSHDKEE